MKMPVRKSQMLPTYLIYFKTKNWHVTKNFWHYRSWWSWMPEIVLLVFLSTLACQRSLWCGHCFWFRRKCVYEQCLMTTACGRPAEASCASVWSSATSCASLQLFTPHKKLSYHRGTARCAMWAETLSTAAQLYNSLNLSHSIAAIRYATISLLLYTL